MRRPWIVPRMVLFVLAAWGAAGAGPARAGEEKSRFLPSDGFDLVRLDDGRTLRCRAGPKVNGVHRLEFADGAVEAPASRIDRILHFRDFDPEPRDEGERAKADRGLMRWAGQWLTPARVADLRRSFLIAEEAAWSETVPAPDWERRHRVYAGGLVVETDLPLVRAREFGRLLEAFLEFLKSELRVRYTRIGSAVPVYIHRDRAGFDRAAARDRVVMEHAIGYYKPGEKSGTGHLVLYDLPGEPDRTLDVLLHEATHLFLDAASGRAFAPVRPWLNEGLAEYLGGSEWKYGKFRPGALQEERLLRFKEMIEEDRVIPLGELVRTVPWEPSEYEDGVRGEFGLDHYAQSWCFVHFLIHGRQTLYRGPFRDFMESGDYYRGESVASLLSRIKRRDFEMIQRQLVDYGRGLVLTGGRAYARRALLRAAEGDLDGAGADLDRAVERAGGDLPTMVFAGRAARFLGRTEQAAELFAKVLEADPLDARIRLQRAWCTEGEEALGEARLAAALAPDDAEVAAVAARRMQSLLSREGGEVGDAGDAGEVAREPDGPAPAAGAFPTDERSAAALEAYGAAVEGDLDRARSLLEGLGMPEHPRAAGVAAGTEILLGNEEGMAARLLAFRKAARARGKESTGSGGGETPGDRIATAVEAAAAIGLHAGERERTCRALDRIYSDEDPGTPKEWAVWATAAMDLDPPTRARAIAAMGLRAFPRSKLLRGLLAYLDREDR